MKAALGQLFVAAALFFAVAAALAGLGQGARGRTAGFGWTRRLLLASGGAVALAAAVMEWALVSADFSVRYVAKVGSLAAPWWVAVSSLWAAQSGSLLLWALLLGGFCAAFALTQSPSAFGQLSLGVLGALLSYFLFLLAGPLEPFAPGGPVPADGPGPAPLLQDNLLMLVHPPSLYAGYVGLAVPFAMAVAALVRRELPFAEGLRLRRWALVSFALLTLGTLLGAWWAYAVLGWGGYWAWDPVENASLMPWLVAGALVHALLVWERRRALVAWTLLLSLLGFSLVVLGTFITRGGAFGSVHAFTRSSSGVYFGAAWAVLTGLSVALVVARAGQWEAKAARYGAVSKETSLLGVNLVLVLLAGCVLLGTAYPVVAAMGSGAKVAVGRAYFDAFAGPFALWALFLLGVGPSLPWGESSWRLLRQRLWVPSSVASLVAGALLLSGYPMSWSWAVLALCGFAAAVTAGNLAAALRAGKWPLRPLGAGLSHLGFVLLVAAVALSSAKLIQSDAQLVPGESFSVGPYHLRYDGLVTREEPHRRWVAAALTVTSPDGSVRALSGEAAPRLTFYPRREEPIGSPAIAPGVRQDLYVTLGGFDPVTKAAGFRAWVFPGVSWLWVSMPFLVVGTLLAAAGARTAPRPGSSETASSTQD